MQKKFYSKYLTYKMFVQKIDDVLTFIEEGVTPKRKERELSQ